jgi:uncharacterized protein
MPIISRMHFKIWVGFCVETPKRKCKRLGFEQSKARDLRLQSLKSILCKSWQIPVKLRPVNPTTQGGFWHFWLTRAVLAVIMTIAIRVIVAILDGANLPVFLTRAIGFLIGVGVLIGLGKIAWLQASINGLMPTKPARGLLFGAVAGTVLYSFIVLIAAIAGWYAVQNTSLDVSSLLGSFALLVFAAAFEEILFRGILFQTLESALGTAWALALSGTLFGVLHLGNTNATITGAIAVGLAGVALGAVFAWTRDLWLLIGIHLMWNFMQGPIFGVAVSGNTFASLIKPIIQGSEVFTGGAFGFESGVITIALCLISTIWLVRRTQQSKRWYGAGQA